MHRSAGLLRPGTALAVLGAVRRRRLVGGVHPGLPPRRLNRIIANKQGPRKTSGALGALRIGHACGPPAHPALPGRWIPDDFVTVSCWHQGRSQPRLGGGPVLGAATPRPATCLTRVVRAPLSHSPPGTARWPIRSCARPKADSTNSVASGDTTSSGPRSGSSRVIPSSALSAFKLDMLAGGPTPETPTGLVQVVSDRVAYAPEAAEGIPVQNDHPVMTFGCHGDPKYSIDVSPMGHRGDG